MKIFNPVLHHARAVRKRLIGWHLPKRLRHFMRRIFVTVIRELNFRRKKKW